MARILPGCVAVEQTLPFESLPWSCRGQEQSGTPGGRVDVPATGHEEKPQEAPGLGKVAPAQQQKDEQQSLRNQGGSRHCPTGGTTWVGFCRKSRSSAVRPRWTSGLGTRQDRPQGLVKLKSEVLLSSLLSGHPPTHRGRTGDPGPEQPSPPSVGPESSPACCSLSPFLETGHAPERCPFISQEVA